MKKYYKVVRILNGLTKTEYMFTNNIEAYCQELVKVGYTGRFDEITKKEFEDYHKGIK